MRRWEMCRATWLLLVETTSHCWRSSHFWPRRTRFRVRPARWDSRHRNSYNNEASEACGPRRRPSASNFGRLIRDVSKKRDSEKDDAKIYCAKRGRNSSPVVGTGGNAGPTARDGQRDPFFSMEGLAGSG